MQKKQQGNRAVYPLGKLAEGKLCFSKVAEAMADYISKAERFTHDLADQHDNLTRKEQAIVAEWNYWVREMTIKAGEWVEIFLDHDGGRLHRLDGKRSTKHPGKSCCH